RPAPIHPAWTRLRCAPPGAAARLRTVNFRISQAPDRAPLTIVGVVRAWSASTPPQMPLLPTCPASPAQSGSDHRSRPGRSWPRSSTTRPFAVWLPAATTGMRRGELLGLRWGDIDLDAGEDDAAPSLTATLSARPKVRPIQDSHLPRWQAAE